MVWGRVQTLPKHMRREYCIYFSPTFEYMIFLLEFVVLHKKWIKLLCYDVEFEHFFFTILKVEVRHLIIFLLVKENKKIVGVHCDKDGNPNIL